MINFPVIDCHNHIWKLENNDNFSWITEGMDIIKRDFSLSDLKNILQKNNITGSILVQAIPVTSESEYLLKLADKNDFIKGIIGWCDIGKGAKSVQKSIDNLNSKGNLLKGIRHMSQGLPSKHLVEKDFIQGCQTVGKNNLVYELLITASQLPDAIKLVQSCPDVTFVIEHIAKPNIKRNQFDDWQYNMNKISNASNKIYCKISGMVTEADWHNWKQDDFEPYMNTIYNAFGENKIIFGSDWPVCQVAAQYEKVLSIVKTWLFKNPQINQEKFFYQNALTLYKIQL